MNFSRPVLRRFLRLLLGIQKPNVALHQTLTFHPLVRDAKKAKSMFNTFSKRLGEKFPEMGTVYMMQQASGAFHFHVLLLFFSAELPFPPSKMPSEIGKIAFRIWSKLQTGKPSRRWNQTNAVANVDPSYWLKDVTIADSTERPSSNPFGQWNRALLDAHRCAPDEMKVKAFLDECAQRSQNAKRVAMPRPNSTVRHYTARDLLRIKWGVEATERARQKEDWEGFKQRETKQSRKVSDREFLAFLNRKPPWENADKSKAEFLF
jgi:hypothetical protein